MFKIRYPVAAAGVVAVAAIAIVADVTLAQTGDTRDIQVTATVKGSCRFESTPNIDFGDLDPSTATDKKQTVNVGFKCTKGVTYTLAVGNGLNYQGGLSRMKNAAGTEYIAYEITPKSQQGTGKGFQTGDTVTLEGAVKAVDYQNAAVGYYTDTVTLSIQP